ncbi:MAG: amidase [Armatimonadetes bacterium]|nr:amidase [Armatimonadota bacterium]
MTHPEFLSYTIQRLVPLFRARTLSPLEVTRACLDRIGALNTTLSTYVTVMPEQALAQAREAEAAYQRGTPRSPLDGVPVSVKDVFETRGIPTTWGTRELAGYVTAEDSTVVARLTEAGAVLLGKANPDIYPYHGTPDSPRLIGPTRNPWDPARTAGRSSGGSAAAVAALMDYSSIGSDTGGSIRIPAALCGVVGYKPTFGLVSKYRIFPYSDTADHPGPIARSVYDCALLLNAIAGYDRKDPRSINRPVPDFTRDLDETVRGLRVGLPKAAAWLSNDPEVTRLVDDAVRVLAGLGMEMGEVDLPYLEEAQRWGTVLSVLETMVMTDAMMPAAQADDVYARYLLGRERAGRRRVLEQGWQIMRAAQARYMEILRDVDLIAMPTVATTAPPFTEERSPWQLPEEMYIEVVARYTRIFARTHLPAISVPCGFAADGMPVGLQIAGRLFEDEVVLRAAHAYQRATDWHTRHPPLS